MKLIEITEKDIYNKFVKAQTRSQFLQSWEWGDFEMEINHVAKRYGLYGDNDELLSVFTLILRPLFLGWNYFYCPRAEFGRHLSDFGFVVEAIKKIAVLEKVLFLRYEPMGGFKISSDEFEIIKTIDVQPSKTLILDLKKSEEELLKEMHQKTRYNIRLAEKKGVEIFPVGTDMIEAEFENFWELMRITKERDAFRIHEKKHYQKMLEIGFVKLYLAKKDEKILAAALVSFFGDTATYIHGASSDEDRNLMAPLLLQWEMIKAGKGRSCQYYDFYGIDEKKWPGVTRFKKGFGGEELNFPGTFDLIFNNFVYKAYMYLRALRRLKFGKR